MATHATTSDNDVTTENGIDRKNETEIESAAADYRHAGETKRRIAPLLARRRENLDRDGHIEEFDHIDNDGHKIGLVIRPDGTGSKEVGIDLTALGGAAPSTTANLDLLVIEARLLADGKPIKNPHVPSNDGVLRAALDHLRPEGLTPAWEVSHG
jgi:hypothetical protein